MSTYRVVYKPTGELILEAAARLRREREDALRARRVEERFQIARREWFDRMTDEITDDQANACRELILENDRRVLERQRDFELRVLRSDQAIDAARTWW